MAARMALVHGSSRHAVRIALQRPCCRYKSSSSGKIIGIPLTNPIDGLPKVVTVPPSGTKFASEVTTLPSGMRVASVDAFGLHCTVGVVINAGPRHEGNFFTGVSHVLEKLAFGGTEKFPTRDHILGELERLGGICDCQIGRDTSIFALSVRRDKLSSAIELLAQSILRPNLGAEHVEEAKRTVRFEWDALDLKPDPEALLQDVINQAAYRENTLGRPRLCPLDRLPAISPKLVQSFIESMFRPERMVIAAVGASHQHLVELVTQNFQPLFPKSTKASEADDSISQWTGGQIMVKKELASAHADFPPLAHLLIGLYAPSHVEDQDFVPSCVLNLLMGGGGSFSAGGPGKGMFSRLYQRVLNRHHWVFSALALQHTYSDGGVFVLHGAAPPDRLQELAKVLCNEIAILPYEKIDNEELSRAKRQLQSTLMMNLETRPVIFEDLGRQVLARGRRIPPEQYYDMIEKVTADDIVRVVHRMINNIPALAGVGDISQAPKYQDIIEMLQKPATKKRFWGSKVFQ